MKGEDRYRSSPPLRSPHQVRTFPPASASTDNSASQRTLGNLLLSTKSGNTPNLWDKLNCQDEFYLKMKVLLEEVETDENFRFFISLKSLELNTRTVKLRCVVVCLLCFCLYKFAYCSISLR
jgi:hypothetical protein